MKNKYDLMQAEELARTYFEQGYHCSEATVRTILETIDGTADPVLLRISNPFCGGISSMGTNACGVLTGGLIVIGAKLGRTKPEEDDTLCLNVAKEFFRQFEEMAGCSSVNCDCLKAHRLNNSCSNYVANGTRLAIQLLEKNEAL